MEVLILNGLGLLYVLWILFIALRASTLKEVTRGTWDYYIYENCISGHGATVSTCDYVGRVGFFAPILFIFGGAIFLLIVSVIVAVWFLIWVPARLLFHWVIFPLFWGSAPAEAILGSKKEYLKKLINPETSILNRDQDYDQKIIMHRFIQPHPIIWIATFAVIYQNYHVISAVLANKMSITNIEAMVTFALTPLLPLVVLFFLLKAPSKMKGAWGILKEKSCRKIEIV